MTSSTFEIRLLGRFVALRDGREVPPGAFGGRLPRRLVRVLLIHRGDHVPKDVLAEALWPVRAPSDPGANLEVLVSRARRALGDPELVLTGPGGYAFTADERCRVDAEQLLRAVERGRDEIRSGRPAAALTELEPAVETWAGEPLAEDLYEDWAGAFRARLQAALQEALELAAEAALSVGDPGLATAFAGRAASREPLREAAALLQVRSLAAIGDRAGALEVFDRFRIRYADELGLDPSAEAAALHASVLRGDVAALPPVRAPDADVVAATTDLPFAGRDAELDAALRAAPGRVVLVSGVSGSGKTRFLDEIARLVDVPVLRATSVLPERDEPWGLARSILREALAFDALAIHALPDLSAAALADVLPEIGELRSERDAGVDRESRRTLAVEGARRVLETVAASGAMLIVDDLQWADATSLHLLAILAARVPTIRLVLAFRSDEAHDPAAIGAFLAGLGRSGAVVEVEMGPLPVETVQELTGDDRVARAIASEAPPTPLVVGEVVRLLEERGLLAADATGRRRALRPIDVEAATDAARAGGERATIERVARLGQVDRELLEVMAVLGRDAPAAMLAAATGSDPAGVLASLDALTHAGLVRPDERGWALAHDSFSGVIGERLEAARRIRLHGVLASVLESEGAETPEVAAHLAAAGDVRAAIARYADAAELALARSANEEGLRLADAALGLAPGTALEARLLAVRAEARFRVGDLDPAKEDLREALAKTPAGHGRADLLTRLALLESGSEDYAAAGRLVELALSEAGEDPRRRAEAHAVGSIVDLNLGDLERSELRAKTALELFEANGDARGAAGILDGRAMATFLGGRIREAADAFDRVARLFRDAGELLRVGTPRSTRGHALVFLDRPREGLEDVEEALALAVALGHAEGESYARWHRAEALAALGRGEEAVGSATEALAIAERIRHREWTAAALRGLGIGFEATGDLERAVETHRRGLDVSEGMPLFATWAAARLASGLVGLGRLEDAAAALARADPERTPLGAFEVRLAEAELLSARGDDDASAFATAAAEIAEDGGHVSSAIRLRGLASGQFSA